MTDEEFKKKETESLKRLLDKGYLEEVETTCRVIDKKITRIEKTFKVDVKGVILHNIE